MGLLAGMLKQATGQLEYPDVMSWGPQLDPNSRPGIGESVGSTLGGQGLWMLSDQIPFLRGLGTPVAGGLSSWLTRTGKIPFTNINVFKGEAQRQREDAGAQGYNAGWVSPFVARYAAGRRR